MSESYRHPAPVLPNDVGIIPTKIEIIYACLITTTQYSISCRDYPDKCRLNR